MHFSKPVNLVVTTRSPKLSDKRSFALQETFCIHGILTANTKLLYTFFFNILDHPKMKIDTLITKH